MYRTCPICEKVFKTKPNGRNRLYCFSCSVPGDGSEKLYSKQINSIKDAFGSSCATCGYNNTKFALELHHIEPKNKSFTMSGQGRSFQALLEESKKCILICSNCHREFHAGLIKELPKIEYTNIDRKLNFLNNVLEENYNNKTNRCSSCGVVITRGAKNCIPCASDKRRVIKRPDKIELAVLISKNSFAHVGRLYGVSDNSIRKWCVFYDLPRRKKEIVEWVKENT